MKIYVNGVIRDMDSKEEKEYQEMTSEVFPPAILVPEEPNSNN